MRDLGSVIAHIPARAGSKRLPSKNLRYLAGQPLIAYAVRAALGCKSLDSVYVNTNSDSIAALAKELGASVYKRRNSLASDRATSDDFNLDIMEALNPDTLVMINSVCPLIDSADIDAAIGAYRSENVDTLITATATRMQCFYRNQPVNIDLEAPLAPTQKNDPVHACNWAVTIWDTRKFRKRFHQQGYAVFGERRMLFPISSLKGTKVSTEEDFRLAELLIKCLKGRRDFEPNVKYWSK